MAIKKSILVVDDSPLIIERLKELLQDLDNVHSIANAGDYNQSIKILTENKIDIAFLDIHLPGKNGIELLQFIKTNYPAINVIMLSNQSNTYYRTFCKKSGAANFFDKSKEFEMIPAILSSFE